MPSPVRDGWLLSAGTLTVVRWPAPARVDRRVAGLAMLMAPLAVVPIGLAVALVVWLGDLIDAPALVVGLLAVGVLGLGSRGLHLDGLSDVADSLTASHDRERSLEVMKGGTAGPAGAATMVVVLGLQAASIAALVGTDTGPLVAGALVCLSRCALTLDCVAGVPPARDSGLAISFAQTVSRLAAAATWLLVVVTCLGLALSSDLPWWRGLVLAGALALGAVAVLERCVRRHGGVTGDCFGASIEVALAAGLVVASIP
ncbi:adenosylcobinamide-GDP ribazoletransferase [Aeromicrobium sp. Leaf350]|uniref:adenosylcobinamide-GDP ribazoletransferase n=1 Tax=Aeromicrobium sp. Leaf350 TaxID=2876565 RepID=UPI001E2FEB1C|nr:adenosylcobinamide-GDP ribazoletransferase [Aeromicrobium sp. Leaf350]